MNSACFYINIYIENIKLLYQPRWQNYLYYSFSCFSEKIISIAWSFRMRYFTACEAMTTAEPPEPFASFVINVLFNQYILLAVAARRRGILSILCVLWTLMCWFFVLFMLFVVPIHVLVAAWPLQVICGFLDKDIWAILKLRHFDDDSFPQYFLKTSK